MKFGQTFARKRTPEWRLHYVEYNALKQRIKALGPNGDKDAFVAQFMAAVGEQAGKVERFVEGKLTWCAQWTATLGDRVHLLESSGAWQHDRFDGMAELSECEEDSDEEEDPGRPPLDSGNASAGDSAAELEHDGDEAVPPSPSFPPRLTEYIYAKKTVVDFQRELQLLDDFVFMNSEAIRKLLKKLDRWVGTAVQATFLAGRRAACPRVWVSPTAAFAEGAGGLLARVNALQPHISLQGRKVYTVGCFDLFHRGHERLLKALRWFGTYIVVGVHDDESYFKLKGKRTIDNTLTRLNNVRRFADMVFVIPDTDPSPWLRCMVSPQDLDNEVACYVRGEDMPNFPGRDAVEGWGMPVHLLPRSEGVSSTHLRGLYHGGPPDKALAGDASAAAERALAQARQALE